MTILTTAYNCEVFIERSLYSIMSQQFTDFTCYIFDDMSTDNTTKKVEDIIKDDSRFILIKNSKKLYQPGNYDLVIRHMNLSDEEICVEVDGDDWLPNSNVLGLINETYKDENVWMTSGSFRYSNGSQGFSVPPINFENIRKQNFTLSHLRTWKSWLWKKIEEEDLKDSEGNYHSDELRLNSELYIVPKNRERVIIPFHLCRVEFEIYGIPTFESNWISLNPASGINDKPGSLTIESTRHEIIINGPGKLSLKAAAEIPSLPEDAKNCDIRISIYLLPTGANRPVVLTKILPYPKEKSSASAIANFLK